MERDIPNIITINIVKNITSLSLDITVRDAQKGIGNQTALIRRKNATFARKSVTKATVADIKISPEREYSKQNQIKN